MNDFHEKNNFHEFSRFSIYFQQFPGFPEKWEPCLFSLSVFYSKLQLLSRLLNSSCFENSSQHLFSELQLLSRFLDSLCSKYFSNIFYQNSSWHLFLIVITIVFWKYPCSNICLTSSNNVDNLVWRKLLFLFVIFASPSSNISNISLTKNISVDATNCYYNYFFIVYTKF